MNLRRSQARPGKDPKADGLESCEEEQRLESLLWRKVVRCALPAEPRRDRELDQVGCQVAKDEGDEGKPGLDGRKVPLGVATAAASAFGE